MMLRGHQAPDTWETGCVSRWIDRSTNGRACLQGLEISKVLFIIPPTCVGFPPG